MEQKFNIIKPTDNPTSKRELKGETYLNILKKVTTIALYQKNAHIEKGIKGFLFHGDVGLGKTLTAKVLASEMAVPLLFIDGSDIARKFYGESENQVSEIFKEAKRHRFVVVLIDDAESVFPTRDWEKSESWHFAQNNVFFHQLDNIDTSKIIVILTTNRYDLIDKAVIDRLYPIEFPLPNKKVLLDIAEYKCNQLRMKPDEVFQIIKHGMIDKRKCVIEIKTIRQLEKLIMEQYIEEVLRKSDII